MLTYLIILLDDTSVSFCHYDASERKPRLMDIDVLRRGIVWAMKENLNIQFVYPAHALPKEHEEQVETIDHAKIKPETQADGADVVVLTNWHEHIADAPEGSSCIIHATRQELIAHEAELTLLLKKSARLNVVLTDVTSFNDTESENYRLLLERLDDKIADEYAAGHFAQLNLLTDRMLLDRMNNCGAGDTTVTLAPNGKFYLCPAFYYEDAEQNSIGDITTGLNIKNHQLLRLDHAPICRKCDAYHCRRCVWMNERLTGDLNTPSHQQCVIAHLERNASRRLQQIMEKRGITLEDSVEIPEVDYLDPFDVVNRWK